MDRLSGRTILKRLLFYNFFNTISTFLVWWSKARKTPTHNQIHTTNQTKPSKKQNFTSQNSIKNQSFLLVTSPSDFFHFFKKTPFHCEQNPQKTNQTKPTKTKNPTSQNSIYNQDLYFCLHHLMYSFTFQENPSS